MKKFLIVWVLAGCWACSEKSVEAIPDDVLPIEKMTAIMVDVQLIEGGIVIRKYNKTQRKDQITDYYKSLYFKHEISKEIFDYSLKYYTDHPGKLEEIYERMLEKLSELEAEVENEKSDTSSVEGNSKTQD